MGQFMSKGTEKQTDRAESVQADVLRDSNSGVMEKRQAYSLVLLARLEPELVRHSLVYKISKLVRRAKSLIGGQ